MPIKFLKTIYINLCAMRIRLQKNRRFLSDFSHFHEKGRAKARCFGKNNAKTGTPETCIQQKGRRKVLPASDGQTARCRENAVNAFGYDTLLSFAEKGALRYKSGHIGDGRKSPTLVRIDFAKTLCHDFNTSYRICQLPFKYLMNNIRQFLPAFSGLIPTAKPPYPAPQKRKNRIGENRFGRYRPVLL